MVGADSVALARAVSLTGLACALLAPDAVFQAMGALRQGIAPTEVITYRHKAEQVS